MRLVIAVLFSFITLHAAAQETEAWSLERAVRYALDNNLTIRQNELNARVAELTLRQSRLSQIPSVNMNSAYGRSFGRSVDPTTNQFVHGSYDFISASGSADVLLFGWFQKRNTITANRFSLEAANADLDQLKDDISLNVATGYLRALLAKEQIRVSEKQVDLSKAQLHQTRQFVLAGRLPELNAAQLESQLATDSSNLINSISAYNSALIDLRALLNLDFTVPFDVIAPEVEVDDQLTLLGLTPEAVFQEAARHFGAIRGNQLRIQAADKRIAAARGALYPQLGINATFGTNYATTFTEVTGVTLNGYQVTPNYAQSFTDTSRYFIYQPDYTLNTRRIPLATQLENNFRQTVSLGLTIPVFNGWQAQTALRQAKIDKQANVLNLDQAELTLKQDVYKAYNEAINAIQKYNAAERSVFAAQRAFEFAEKRYELGLTNTVEYLTTQNNQFITESNLLSAKYDLIFKLKVIDYYLGKELKL